LGVFVLPVCTVIDHDLVYKLWVTVYHRHCQPLPALRRFDPVSVLPLVLFELDVIKQDKDVCSIDLMKVPQPWKVLGLMNGNNHGMPPQRYPPYFSGASLSPKNAPAITISLGVHAA
jgi:hypothetical protein